MRDVEDAVPYGGKPYPRGDSLVKGDVCEANTYYFFILHTENVHLSSFLNQLLTKRKLCFIISLALFGRSVRNHPDRKQN